MPYAKKTSAPASIPSGPACTAPEARRSEHNGGSLFQRRRKALALAPDGGSLIIDMGYAGPTMAGATRQLSSWRVYANKPSEPPDAAPARDDPCVDSQTQSQSPLYMPIKPPGEIRTAEKSPRKRSGAPRMLVSDVLLTTRPIRQPRPCAAAWSRIRCSTSTSCQALEPEPEASAFHFGDRSAERARDLNTLMMLVRTQLLDLDLVFAAK